MNHFKKHSSVGGQAVIEGVMMRNKTNYALAVRSPSSGIVVIKNVLAAPRRPKILNLPVIRGAVALVDSMILGVKMMTKSADIALEDTKEQEPASKFEIWLESKLGDKLPEVMVAISVIVALVIGTGLFILLPAFIASLANPLIGGRTWVLAVLEGLLRIGILVMYIFAISRMDDIQRVFQYHGAEHKCINCLESNSELTVQNVMRFSRLHRRCGTSFLLFVMLISMVTFFFVRTDVVLMRFGMRILLVPFIAGVSYEAIRWAGRSDSRLVNLISMPGMWLQRLTTREPDAQQVEVAISALNGVLESDG